VRLDLPAEEAGDEPDERYRRAARTLAAWRSDGTFRKDPHPSIYVYEQTYCVPGTAPSARSAGSSRGCGSSRSSRVGGPAARADAAGPKEDRYKLLRATGVNTVRSWRCTTTSGGAGAAPGDADERPPAVT
jgi:hypothetical protein